MSFLDLLNEIPIWVFILDGLVLLAVLVLWAGNLINGLLFMKALEKCVIHEELAQPLIKEKYTGRKLLHRNRLIEKAVKVHGNRVISLTGIDRLWTRQLKKTGSRSYLKRILKYNIQRGLYTAFLCVTEKPKLRPLLTSWLQEHDRSVGLRKIALSGKGQGFLGTEAIEFLKEYKDILRDLTGDPEWTVRFFALKILIADPVPQSVKLVQAALKDHHPLIRKTIIEEIPADGSGRRKLYKDLLDVFLNDPKREVRYAAKQKLDMFFSDQYTLSPDALTPTQCVHVVDLLDPLSKEDENTAFEFLEKNDLEIRMTAASYLDHNGGLSRLLLNADLGDRKSFKRKRELLTKAAETGAYEFLNTLETCSRTGSLALAAELLEKCGNRESITLLAEKVFSLQAKEKLNANNTALYTQTIRAIAARGTEEALTLFVRELIDNALRKELQLTILNTLESVQDTFLSLLIDPFLQLLMNPAYPAADDLRRHILRIPHTLYLHRVLDAVKAPRERYTHKTRIELFRLLIDMKQPYCIQYIIENLSILPLHESRQFTNIFSGYDEKLFIKRATEIFEHVDSKSRSTLMLCLPGHLREHFKEYIHQGLNDPDPEVRIASVWTLHDMDEPEVLHLCLDHLRDPVERVRKAVAHALGCHGGPEALKELKKVLTDSDETDSVKSAAVFGLGESKEEASTAILIDTLDASASIEEKSTAALSQKTTEDSIIALLEAYRNSSSSGKDRIAKAIRLMGEQGEKMLLQLLSRNKELAESIYSIMEYTGFIASKIKLLHHRDPLVRKEAADILLPFKTPEAYKGMVLAARDPNEEIRKVVASALSVLLTKEGSEILDALEKDPDKRVKKYTSWAVNRLKAGELV